MYWFRTTATGDAVFGVTPLGAVLRVGAFTGFVMEAVGAWNSETIGMLSVPPDVAEWLSTLPASP